ncbi:threonine aldolase family protein [Haloarchaeobius sp. TZWWS8]|uniref:threonine aldolase family protein n=1 Tax=Haloarchaeobius sp. TZWWS8 TaxID=3446121 RepID=UPI003EC128E3
MIDLRSDTVTKPDEAMREAARDAVVGDDVYGEDPTVNELEAEAAKLVGKEAALYVPSGTMGNQLAARTHTDRGQEVLTERQSHVVKWELGGFAQLSQLQVKMLDGGSRGVPTPEQVHENYVEEDLHTAGTGLLTLENTHNAKGGIAIEPEKIAAAAEAAHEHDVPVHLDGARVCNAAVALDVPVTELTDPVDSVMFCLSKGLGAPVGSMLAGSEEFIARARRNRKLLGGGMRQAGIVAAPGLRALSNVERLADDHENAKALAAGLDGVSGLRVPEPETNIVLVHTQDAGVTAGEFLDACEERDVLGVQFGEYTARFCTHWNVDESDIAEAVERVAGAL